MFMQKIGLNFPMVNDIIGTYRVYRERGHTRDVAIEQLREEYSRELADYDDGPIVQIGLALALCKKDELTQNVLADAQTAVRKLLFSEERDSKTILALQELEAYVSEPQRLGNEAKYRARKPYIPQWEIGDTFAHTLTHPMSKYAGVYGWYVLFRKVGEYVDGKQRHRQLVYVTLCPPDRLPQTEQELQKLGFLRMMARNGGKWDYLAQITFKGKKDEAAYELTRIGSFPGAGSPEDRAVEDPLTVMPLFGKLRRDNITPEYEDAVCRIYKNNGIRL